MAAGRPIRLFAVRSRPESLDDFELLALGFPEIDNLALPAGLRVEPPSAGDRSGNQNAEIDQLLDRLVDGLLVHPEGLGDFDLWDADDVVEVETGVEVHENPVDLQPDVTPGGELFEEMLVDLHPTFTVGAVDLGPTEYWIVPSLDSKRQCLLSKRTRLLSLSQHADRIRRFYLFLMSIYTGRVTSGQNLAVRSRPESLDDFELLALGFPKVDDLALPAGLRVEPPTARPTDLRATDDDAQLFQSLNGAVDVLRL